MKIAVLGPGSIAGKTVATMAALPGIECYAVASGSLERAQAFAAKHGFQKAYGSYEEMRRDPRVEGEL